MSIARPVPRVHPVVRALLAGCCLSAASLAAPSSMATAAAAAPDVGAPASDGLEVIVVTARKRAENVQDVPIAVSVLSGDSMARQGTYTIQQVSQQAPTLQYTSSNPRNTALTVRGLGVSFGLANDGLEQGVGFYVDQVYNSRPAAAAFDLIDIERVEVLRGPQGTLFGKNTTAGALNISTRAPSFTPEAQLEGTLGTQSFYQAKGMVSGPLADSVAGRLTVAKSRRDGFTRNVTTGRNVNDQDNLGLRSQLQWNVGERSSLRLIGDYSLQDADCCTQVTAAIGSSQRPAARQFPALAAALGYSPPSLNPYDRLADADAPIKARSEIGGLSLTGETGLGSAQLTSISAWRWWDWQPANDRDYTRLDILRQSANPVQQTQYSQELRLAGNTSALAWTTGVYGFYQRLKGQNVTEWGSQAAYWLIGSTVPADLLAGYTTRSAAVSTIASGAVFSQVTWTATDRLSVTPGLRYTRERKTADYASVVSGGNTVTSTSLRNERLKIARPQAYVVDFDAGALTGDLALAYTLSPSAMAYASAARGFKSGGINLAGLPLNSSNIPALNRAVVDPERSTAFELGLKTQWLQNRVTANAALFRSDVRDFQANVVDAGPGALRGYLANIDHVRSQGVELDLTVAPAEHWSSYLRGAFTDAQYLAFTNAPCPLELQTSTTAACDLSGTQLPGVSRWSLAGGLDYRRDLGGGRELQWGLDGNWRSAFYADASASRFLRIEAYGTVNLRAGYTTARGVEFIAQVRNLFDTHYLQLLTPQSGNSGLISGLPGDPRTFQITARYHTNR